MKKAKTKDKNSVGFGKLLIWCGQDASRSVHVVLTGALLVYCTSALGLDPTLVGAVMMASKIVDAVTDLLAGYIVDKTNTKLGRGRPYSLCILGLWLATWAMFSVPEGFQTTAKLVWIFFAYMLSESIFLTFLNAGGTPYMVRAFNSQEAYVKLSSFGGLIVTVAVIVFNVIFPMMEAQVLYSASGWSRLVLMIAIPMIIIGILRFLFVPEKYVVEEATNQHVKISDIFRLLRENKNIYPVAALQFVTGISGSLAVSTYYYMYIVRNVEIQGVMSLFAIIPMLSMALFPLILKKLSMVRFIQYAYLLPIFSGIVTWLAKDNLVLLGVAGIISGLSTLPGSYLGGLLNIDIADYNEWVNRPRMEGTITAVTGFANKVGSAFSSYLLGILLSVAGFVESSETQPDSALLMIRFIQSWIPAIFGVLCVACLAFYGIEKVRPQMNAELAERRAARAAEQQQ